ncbi:MAG TPA: hypothetical protein VLT36_08020 [Candidatus Dormibacteraeota bacterium]|nr:hypothetical protein [Candidatus Dormibacteraeota bacterium]
MKANWFVLVLAVGLLRSAHGASSQVLYENNFEKAELRKVPEDFLVLDGGFAVKEDSGNRFLELPGSPLDSFSVQFGPSEGVDVAVSARILGIAKGRRFPTFGVGLCGAGGYKLQVSPAKQAIELLKDQAVLASAKFDWKSGEWDVFKLELTKAGDATWKLRARVWAAGEKEPENWMIHAEEKEEPIAGRPSVFGSPFSGTPIRFDDLKLEKVKS